MRKTYQVPKLMICTVDATALMQSASGVYSDGTVTDIIYDGTDDGDNDPEAKPFSVWDE